MRESIIIIEGAQGVGKTTATDYLRNKLPYTNLYRLSGNKDKSETGLIKAEEMYDDLLQYMSTLQHKDINLLFDRTFFSEEAYARLGYKDYSFTHVYEKLLDRLNSLDFDIYYIVLYLEDTSLFAQRLKREGKANVKFVEFNSQNSINQQNTYLQMADEIQGKYDNIKVMKVKNDLPNMATDVFDEIFKELMKK
ncbi:MAG: hypothetical protein E7311_06050 [Clostridiales bacterium]|nr:hypothetical protein [Clostridiales bacterium]